MRQLSENQVKLIENLVRKKGLSRKKVRSEMVDHVSCAVENKLEEGWNFSKALTDVIASFGEDELSVIQRENNALVRKKRSRQLWLSMPIAGTLMFTAIVVNASGRPDTRPIQDNLIAVNESFSKNINGFLYDVTGKLNIYATAKGRVEKIIPFSCRDEKKYSIILKHKNGYKTIYANLQTIDISEGAHVEKGESLGRIYSAGSDRKAFFAYKILNSGRPVDAQSYY
ncbi:MAG: M23 family metallopeptidase [Cytophagales bacterium]|nr:M23 family metallopeptidase [Cytophagales bacterium]